MSKTVSKRAIRWAVIGVVVVVAAVIIGVRYWKAKQSALPEGIVSGNGRIEGKLV